MATADSEPLEGQPARREPDQAGDTRGPTSEPDDEYFSSGSFSPVNVQFGEDPGSIPSDAPE